MNNKVEECKKALIDAIRSSEAYQEYEEMKKKVEKYPELKQQIDQFRRKVYLLQNSNETYNLMDELSEVYRDKKAIYANSIMGDYLRAELHVCRMLQNISMDVLNVTDVEIDTFEEDIRI